MLGRKVKANLSIEEITKMRLQFYAEQSFQNMSNMVTDLIWLVDDRADVENYFLESIEKSGREDLIRDYFYFQERYARRVEPIPTNSSLLISKISDEKGYLHGRLSYNPKNDRYGLINYNNSRKVWVYSGLCCGEPLQVFLNQKWINTTMEMKWGMNGNEWYLVNTPFSGNLENLEVRIKK